MFIRMVAQADSKTSIPQEEEHLSPGQLMRRKIRRGLVQSKPALYSLVFLLGIAVVAVITPLIAPYDPTDVAVLVRLRPPAWIEGGSVAHLLGTDSLGRDILSRIFYGARISILVGLSSVVLSGAIGVILGLLAGFFGGKVDDVIMGLADVQLAFPFILLAITIMAVVGPGLLNVILVLGLSRWVAYGRVVRGQVIVAREREYVEAARALGYPLHKILFQQILPNVTAPLTVIGSFAVAGNIISEASLSFLGLGVPPSVVTWGGMLSEGREYLRIAWWLTAFPGLAIMVTVLCINMLGDWLRDFLDPRMRDDL